MFIVIEAQKTGNQVATLTWSFVNQNEADSKFHQVMAAAAVSQVPVHSCLVIDEYCQIYQNGTYTHKQEETA